MGILVIIIMIFICINYNPLTFLLLISKSWQREGRHGIMFIYYYFLDRKKAHAVSKLNEHTISLIYQCVCVVFCNHITNKTKWMMKFNVICDKMTCLRIKDYLK